MEKWDSVRSEFKEWYHDNYQLLGLAKNLFHSLITSILIDRDDISNPQIESRVKDRNGCLNKFENKYLSTVDDNDLCVEIVREKITDLIGLRVICSYEDEISKIESILKDNFSVLNITDKTSQLSIKEFGYKGIHLDIKLSGDRMNLDEYKKISSFNVEIQIRTLIQHAWSSLDHKIKYKHNISPELSRAVNRLSAIFEIADSEFMRIREATENEERISGEKIKTVTENLSQNPEDQSDANCDSEVEKIDFITFSEFLKMKFPKYQFFEYRTNTMLNELYRYCQNLNLKLLLESFDKNEKVIQEYIQNNYRILSMNPYTILRHILYASNSDLFKDILTPIQKTNFTEYLTNSKQ